MKVTGAKCVIERHLEALDLPVMVNPALCTPRAFLKLTFPELDRKSKDGPPQRIIQIAYLDERVR